MLWYNDKSLQITKETPMRVCRGSSGGGKTMSKKTARAGNRLVFIINILTAVLFVLLLCIVWLTYHENTAVETLPALTIEVGQPVPDARDFFTGEDAQGAVYATDLSSVDTAVPGSYPVTLTLGRKSYTSALTVSDTHAPTGTVISLTVDQGMLPNAEDFFTSMEDMTAVTASYVQEPDVSAGGEQTVKLVLTDSSGNKTEFRAVLTVIVDTQPPVIEGAADILVYQGDAVSYRKGITVTDDKDPAPTLNIDSSKVDLSSPGEYTLTYSATDASGNTATVKVAVTVKEAKEGYAALEEIYAQADALLAKIITEDMTVREQVEAIYAHMKTYGYTSHSDKEDYLQGAYTMMTELTGDCFNYYALCKVMFDRLEIPNIDVRKVKKTATSSDHYWSLVSVDGGETWYHFDTTPRKGTGDNFCLVTDAFLDAYSDSHYGSHNRDKSLYPATPEE